MRSFVTQDIFMCKDINVRHSVFALLLSSEIPQVSFAEGTLRDKFWATVHNGAVGDELEKIEMDCRHRWDCSTRHRISEDSRPEFGI